MFFLKSIAMLFKVMMGYDPANESERYFFAFSAGGFMVIMLATSFVSWSLFFLS